MEPCFSHQLAPPLLFVAQATLFSAQQIITKNQQAHRLDVLFFFLKIRIKFILLYFNMRKFLKFIAIDRNSQLQHLSYKNSMALLYA